MENIWNIFPKNCWLQSSIYQIIHRGMALRFRQNLHTVRNLKLGIIKYRVFDGDDSTIYRMFWTV